MLFSLYLCPYFCLGDNSQKLFDWFLLPTTTCTRYFVKFGRNNHFQPAFGSFVIILTRFYGRLMFPRGTRTFFFCFMNMRVIRIFIWNGRMMRQFFPSSNIPIVPGWKRSFLLTNCLIDRGKLGNGPSCWHNNFSGGRQNFLPAYLNCLSVVCPKTPWTTYWHNRFCEFFFESWGQLGVPVGAIRRR